MDNCLVAENINGVVSGNVILDTRITFSDGGDCGENQVIRRLQIMSSNGSLLYWCVNYTNAPCLNNGSSVVVVPSEPMAHKYDFKIMFMNVAISDGGLYTVEVDNRQLTKIINISITSEFST